MSPGLREHRAFAANSHASRGANEIPRPYAQFRSFAPRDPDRKRVRMTTWIEVESLITNRWGGRRHGRSGSSRFYRVPSPTGGELLAEVTLRPRWCALAVDRWITTDRTDEPSSSWFESHVWPAVRRAAAARGNGRSGFLPSGGGAWSYASPIERADLVDVLTAWVDQELTWGIPQDAGRSPSTLDAVSRETLTSQGEHE